MRRTSIPTATGLVATGCLAALLATACGTRPPASTSATPAPMAPTAPGRTTPGPATGPGASTADTLGPGRRHNEADIEFARQLIPHHRTGIALAGAAAATAPKVRTLAEAIIVTQQDEVVRMTDWLKVWGAAPPGPAAAATPTGDPVRTLAGHQDEAVKIAQAEQANGTNPAALAFAEQLIESRTAQVTELTKDIG
ncbi:hypothetical protein GCM10010172_48190 [Paractinoplanes ferrugineus]|uniref:DUF305 domain-containing protein n=1 Tax=Paractinoplanes ferrugineus TaxID=113564 RepID=A0A919IYB8_9ACTN|nr:DUF305 domain-containing protein [Actinoplanes ferrugineus]GIE11080.1 hypothetical protein Afe05nite_29200 [Actinoplanes ferrugineus]